MGEKPIDPCSNSSSSIKFIVSTFDKCKLMANYAVENGLALPPNTLDILSDLESKIYTDKIKNSEEASTNSINDVDESELERLQTQLVDIVYPATPVTIEYTEPKVNLVFPCRLIWPLRRFIKYVPHEKNTIPVIKTIWWANVVSLLLFVASFYVYSLFPETQYEIIHLVFAASLGSCYYALYTANKYFVYRTFDPKYQAFYYNRIILGIISGVILANVIDLSGTTNSTGAITKLSSSVLALIGGYSAEAVHRILKRLIAMVNALVRGEAEEVIKSKENEYKYKALAENERFKIRKITELSETISNMKGRVSEEAYKELILFLKSIASETKGNKA